MAKPAPKVPKFGAHLVGLRKDRTRNEIVQQMLARAKVQRVGTALYKTEMEGRVPPIAMVRGLSAVYEVPFEDLVDRILSELDVKPVVWRVSQSEAAEVVRNPEETDLLRMFRRVDDPKTRLFLRDTLVRFIDEFAGISAEAARKRTRRMRSKQVKVPPK